jgi:hypothetical protein
VRAGRLDFTVGLRYLSEEGIPGGASLRSAFFGSARPRGRRLPPRLPRR